MGTTTIRISDELKARVDKLAQARNSSSHALMLEAIAEVTDRLERQQDFEAEAARRLQDLQRTGEYPPLDDLRAYAAALARGEQPAKPRPRVMSSEELERFRASVRRAEGA